MTPAIHHAVITVTDIEASLRFYRDGLGLGVLQDRQVEGDWPALFGAPSSRLHAVFLGNPDVPDLQAGVLELNYFDGEAPARVPAGFHAGLAMLSYFVDVDETLARLETLGFTEPARRIDQSTPGGILTIAVVSDPDGVSVLLTPGSLTSAADSPAP
jgi:catechol 2,3-dioxygenase-like lactoylglutathione lyase family enzyme